MLDVLNLPGVATPLGVFKRLAEDEDWRARRAVATNKSALASLVKQLAEDKIWNVRAADAENVATPAAVQEGARKRLTNEPLTSPYIK
jgi:uncharacterized membrane protein YccC